MNQYDVKNLRERPGYLSEKIRKLFREGYQQAKIARILGTTDQYVSQVVLRMKRQEAEKNNRSGNEHAVAESYRLKVGPAGRIVIPASFRERFGLEEGKEVILKADEDSLRIENAVAGLKRAQKLMEKFGVKTGGMADELIRERREEAARDQ